MRRQLISAVTVMTAAHRVARADPSMFEVVVGRIVLRPGIYTYTGSQVLWDTLGQGRLSLGHDKPPPTLHCRMTWRPRNLPSAAVCLPTLP